jgi:Asp-tRNA(Asn)/Glu-tRNA(Gln) amidotransferase A subunit family amidase
VDFRRTTVAEIADEVTGRALSAREVVGAALDRIDRHNAELGAFVAVDAETALAEAAAIDDRIASGEDVGALAGIPVGVKDLEDVVGFVTTRGSPAYAEDPPAASDSPLVERLRAAGCVVVGKTNTPELGWKGDTVNEVFGATHNPWSRERSAGGSSGGSAVAIAAGLVPLATGSDGGGSIRIPSSATGLSGFKPSLGRVPVGGDEPPGWPLLSTKGVMARRIRDVALALDSVVGPEPTDLTSLPLPEASWSRSLADLKPPRRVAWSPDLGYGRVDAEVLRACEAALARLEDLGTEVVVLDRLFDADPVQDWLALVGACLLRSLDRFRGDEDVWRRIDPGLVALVEWARSSVGPHRVIEALDACHRLNLVLVDLFHQAPLLLSPTCAGQLPRVGEPGTINGEPDVNWIMYTYPFNMTRSPAGSVCAGFTDDGMPVGLQVVGPQHGDVVVLRALALLEDALAIDAVAPVGGEPAPEPC